MTHPFRFFSFLFFVCISLVACSPAESREDVSLLSDQELTDIDTECKATGRQMTDTYCQQVAAVRTAKVIKSNQQKVQQQAAQERATAVPSVPLY